MRELFRRNKGLFTESMDLIIVARPEIVDLGFAELEAGYFSALGALTRKRTPG
jgi:RNase P protein component